MNNTAKILFAGDYFPGWQASMSIGERLSYLTKPSCLSYHDRKQMINKQSNLVNKLLMPYYSFNAKTNALSPLILLNDFFKQFDLNCLNLETSLSNNGSPIEGKHYNLRCDPFFIEGLLHSHIKLAILANNHILDYGENSVTETIKLLEKYNISNSGIKQENQSDKQNAIVQNINGINIGFLSYVDPSIIDPTYESYFSKKIYPFKLDPIQVVEDIKKAKNSTDVVVVNTHWGDEWSHLENRQQVDLAHNMIDSGATIVIGHHPHVIQGIEKYNNGLIAYSLGNLFMHLGGISGVRCKKSFLLDFEISKQGIESYNIHPISHNNYGQPYLDNCFDSSDLILDSHSNHGLSNSFLNSMIQDAEVQFLKQNQSVESKRCENFKVDRIIYNSTWCHNDAYVACGKEFSDKHLKPSLICHSGEFDEILITIPISNSSETLKFYAGYPDWYDHNNNSPIKLMIKLDENIIFESDLNDVKLKNLTIDAFDNKKDLVVSLKCSDSNFTCLICIENLDK